MNKILAIVFSKDRASQLDLFLRSMKENCPGVFKTVVLWTNSNYNYLNGYKKVLRRWSNKVYDDVDFVQEDYFKEDVLSIIDNYKPKLVGFFTDDSVFYRKFNLEHDSLLNFMWDNDILGFSTRLGQNIKYQNHWEPLKPVTKVKFTKKNIGDGNDALIWNVKSAKFEEDYGRPISMDGNIHVKDHIYDLLLKRKWNSVRELDSIQPREDDVLSASFKESVLVNVPVNLVAEGKADNYAKRFSYCESDLNDRWIRGHDIDLNIVQGSKVEASHQEYDLFNEQTNVENQLDSKDLTDKAGSNFTYNIPTSPSDRPLTDGEIEWISE